MKELFNKLFGLPSNLRTIGQINEAVENIGGNTFINAYFHDSDDDSVCKIFRWYHTILCYPFTEIWGVLVVPLLKKSCAGRICLCQLHYSPGFVFMLNLDAAIFGASVYGMIFELARRICETYLTK